MKEVVFGSVIDNLVGKDSCFAYCRAGRTENDVNKQCLEVAIAFF